MLTREQIFAAFAVRIASANECLGKAEILNIYTVAKTCRLNFDNAMDACRRELSSASDIKAMAKEMTAAEKKFAIDLAVQISVADGVVSLKELQEVHYFSEILEMNSSVVTISFLQQLRKNPSLKYWNN